MLMKDARPRKTPRSLPKEAEGRGFAMIPFRAKRPYSAAGWATSAAEVASGAGAASG